MNGSDNPSSRICTGTVRNPCTDPPFGVILTLLLLLPPPRLLGTRPSRPADRTTRLITCSSQTPRVTSRVHATATGAESLSLKRFAAGVARLVHHALAISAGIVHYAMVAALPAPLPKVRDKLGQSDARVPDFGLSRHAHDPCPLGHSLKISGRQGGNYILDSHNKPHGYNA